MNTLWSGGGEGGGVEGEGKVEEMGESFIGSGITRVPQPHHH